MNWLNSVAGFGVGVMVGMTGVGRSEQGMILQALGWVLILTAVAMLFSSVERGADFFRAIRMRDTSMKHRVLRYADYILLRQTHGLRTAGTDLPQVKPI